MESYSSLLLALGAVVSAAALARNLLELRALPGAQNRSDYEFAHTLAQRSGDSQLADYAHELGYKMLINDPSLTTLQRKMLLTLPERVHAIPRYMKVRDLLTVKTARPVLGWKRTRHSIRAYREFLVLSRGSLYFLFCFVGMPSLMALLFGPYPTSPWPVLNAILTLPLGTSVSFIGVGAYCLYSSLKLSLAHELVTAAARPRARRQRR